MPRCSQLERQVPLVEPSGAHGARANPPSLLKKEERRNKKKRNYKRGDPVQQGSTRRIFKKIFYRCAVFQRLLFFTISRSFYVEAAADAAATV